MSYEWHLSQNSADLILVTANWRRFIGRSFIYSVLQSIADSLMVTIMLISLFVVQPIVSLIVISILGTTSFLLFTTVRRKLDRVAVKARNFEQSLNKQATKMIHGYKDVKISGKQEIFNTKYAQTLFQVSRIQGTQRLISGLPTWLLESMGFFMISFSICYIIC
jgi:ATP-binding cassette subfamily C protein